VNTNTNASSTLHPVLPVLLLAAIVVGVFGQVVGQGFLSWDDGQHVVGNPRFNPVTLSGVAQFWTEPYWGLYVPLSYTFFAAEAYLAERALPDGAGWTLNPAVFHLGSLLLHVACVLLVFAILRRLVRHDWAACAGAFLFALHPVQVESVAWISETRGLLCAVFSLCAVWLYHHFACRDVTRWAAVYYALATAAFVAGLLCKPAAVAAPLMIGVIQIGLLRRPVRRTLLGLAPWLAIALASVALTKSLQPDRLAWFVPPLWSRPLVAGDALAFYLYKLAVPFQCGPDYGRTPAWVMRQWWLYVAWLPPAAVLIALWFAPGRRLWLTAAGLFVVWLLPVLGFVPFDFQRISTVADRYLYLAMLGPALALSLLLAGRRSRWTLVPAAVLLGTLAFLSFVQGSCWRSDATLFARALRVNPQSVVANHNLGTGLYLKDRFDAAVPYFQRVLDVDANHPESQLGLGAALIELGKTEEALAHLREAVRLKPDWPLAHFHLARALHAQGRQDEAIEACNAALRFADDDSPLRQTIRSVLLQYRREEK